MVKVIIRNNVEYNKSTEQYDIHGCDIKKYNILSFEDISKLITDSKVQIDEFKNYELSKGIKLFNRTPKIPKSSKPKNSNFDKDLLFPTCAVAFVVGLFSKSKTLMGASLVATGIVAIYQFFSGKNDKNKVQEPNQEPNNGTHEPDLFKITPETLEKKRFTQCLEDFIIRNDILSFVKDNNALNISDKIDRYKDLLNTYDILDQRIKDYDNEIKKPDELVSIQTIEYQKLIHLRINTGNLLAPLSKDIQSTINMEAPYIRASKNDAFKTEQ